jgi:hypothetical protein
MQFKVLIMREFKEINIIIISGDCQNGESINKSDGSGFSVVF